MIPLLQFRKARPLSLLDRVRQYKSFLPVHYESNDFIVKTADSGPELRWALELRHDIFHKEWRGEETENGLDLDDYDFKGDHLLIIEKRSNEVIGTYRLLCSQFTDNFYSENEFALNCFLSWPGIKVELGRACIRADHRNGNTIDLLWKGLASYINQSGARYVFGCASVRETDQLLVGRLMKFFEAKEEWSRDHQIWPTPDYRMPEFSVAGVEPMNASEAKHLVPPLLRTYLHAGAQVFGFPALDSEFKCVDLFTILDMDQIEPRFHDRYFSKLVAVK